MVKQNSFLLSIIWIILLVYCFLIFVPIPNSLGTDLELSWQYAISRAAVDRLIFEKTSYSHMVLWVT
ncbi:MAG: hypothetical protein N4J56_001675 [Chroococcidiopsis sp. SAG 2025]|nr:hypothetical protein [Chroococcidiopsis sp. SAG 2025]